MDLLNESTGMANVSLQEMEETSSSDDSLLNRSDSYSVKKKKKNTHFNIHVDDELLAGKVNLNSTKDKISAGASDNLPNYGRRATFAANYNDKLGYNAENTLDSFNDSHETSGIIDIDNPNCGNFLRSP